MTLFMLNPRESICSLRSAPSCPSGALCDLKMIVDIFSRSCLALPFVPNGQLSPEFCKTLVKAIICETTGMAEKECREGISPK